LRACHYYDVGVLPLLIVLFVAVPIVELAVIIQVGQAIGVLETIALMLLVSVVGAWLVKREGIGVWRRAQRQIDAGQVPGRELVDAALIMLAGALLLTPGFLSDCLGILLLLPPVRAGLRHFIIARMRKRVIAQRIDFT
jgi:UPF0716 protein FxsA